ncbi:hypothetical protein [Kitasatospora kifunensis]|uniref:Uncharacterized protein n=1 Tax=Kitasatospora kifunensis TaxID=58351 RepID=A0A7W7W0R1_KITKI|nr:hypothetical protein [Kitasatospora kifunensis]MBB4928979.1 hypothetical protein [Kitasatospora kifunensis]
MPPRSALGLRCQLYLQWIYFPLGALVVFALFLLQIAAAFGGAAAALPGGTGSQPRGTRKLPVDPYGDGLFLTRRQYRLERLGSSEEWRARAGIALQRAIARGEGSGRRSVELPVRVYRGVGIAGVEDLAAPLGWRIDWAQSRFGMDKKVYLTATDTSPR